MTPRRALAGAAEAACALPVLALVALHRLRLVKFETGSCVLALAPGSPGIWLRRHWYCRTLRRCGRNLSVSWMAVIWRPETGIGNDVTIGPYSAVINADIGHDVMLGTNVKVAQGARQHGIALSGTPMARQPGEPVQVRIGNDVWIGTGAVVLADVAEGSVVGAGAVVTRPFEPYWILAGVPARPSRPRA